MDEVFGRVGGKYKLSLADSTMMWIVHRAMDKAHERAQRREGVIECLTEISKFYELAVMQLEGCWRFVQEESDSSFESSDEEVLGDLAEIKDRLVGRLKDAQQAIADKDKELTDRFENEMKLRKELETKERELHSLRAKLRSETAKTEGVEELIQGNQASADEERDEDLSGLKHSVEQQVWNIKQKLEPENKFLDRRRNRSCDSLKIEMMGIDIDILKETLDIAFGKMQSAIFLSETEPVEQQWRWTIEKDALSILVKGFIGDIQESFQSEVRWQEKHISFGWIKHLSDMMKEIKYCHDELQSLCLSESNHEGKISVKPIGTSSSEESSHGRTKNSTSRDMKVDQQTQLNEEDTEDDGENYVAKMIKNHESIIKKKSEELNWAKREILGEKGWPYPVGEDDLVNSRRFRDVIVRMENLINKNEKLSKNFSHHEGDGKEESSSNKRLCNFNNRHEELSLIEDMEDGQKTVNQISISDRLNESFHHEIRMLKEDKEDTSLQTMIMKNTCATLLKGLISDNELCRNGMEILKREGEHVNMLKKMVNELNKQMESDKIDVQITEEIHYMVFSEVVKDFCASLNILLIECQDAMAVSSCLEDYNLEGKLREEISKVFFGEICKEWNEFIERSDTESLVREEIYRIASEGSFRDITETANHIITKFNEVILEGKLREEVSRFLCGKLCKEWKEIIERSDTENLIWEKIYQIALEETLRDIASCQNQLVSKPNEVKTSENCIYGFPVCNKYFNSVEYSIKEDVNKIFFREMCREWKKEIDAHNFVSLIKEEIFLLLVTESVKEASTACKEVAGQDNFKILEDFSSSDKLHRGQEVNEEDTLIQKQDSQLNCEKSLIQTEISEIKEYNAQLKHEKLNMLQISRELLSEMGITCASVSNEVMIALDHLTVSKALVSELRSGLGVAAEDVERFDDQLGSLASARERKPSWLQRKAIKEVKVITTSYSAFTPIMEFFQVFMDFKCRVEEKMELNIMKLEGAMLHLNPLAELVARQRRKEWIYEKAFFNRCENLRKAETEVDLLGNQVEVLSCLLEKIYNMLHHYSPVLQQYFEVSDILKMIRKELIGEVLASSDI